MQQRQVDAADRRMSTDKARGTGNCTRFTWETDVLASSEVVKRNVPRKTSPIYPFILANRYLLI